MAKTVLLYLTHIWNSDIQAEFEKLPHHGDPDMPESWLLFDKGASSATSPEEEHLRCHKFDM